MAEVAQLYAGSDWIAKDLHIEPSPLGKKVADLLGDVFFGIYHINLSLLRKANWTNKDWITIVLYGSLTTVDSDELTRLVVLAHDKMLRMTVSSCSPKYLRLTFWERTIREGSITERCPTIEDHIKQIRACYANT